MKTVDDFFKEIEVLNHNPALQRTVAEGNSKEYMKYLEIIYG